MLQLAIQAVTPLRCEVKRNFPVESFSLHLPLTLAMTVFEPMVLPVRESDFHVRLRAAGSDGYHTINVGFAGRSVKYDRRSYSADEPIAFSHPTRCASKHPAE